MNAWAHEDWQRLGRAVYEARRKLGFRESLKWAEAAGRSTRVLLGLERGEPVGPATLDNIEDALGWPRGRALDVLNGVETVGPTEDSADFVASGSGGPRPLSDYTLAELADEIRRRADEGP